MASTYTGTAANATATLSLMTGGDRPTAQSIRVPLERLLDNDAALTATAADLSDTAFARFMRSALQLREIRLEGTSITDTTENMGAITVGNGSVIAIKTDVSWWVGDWSRPEAVGPVNGIDTGVRDVARSTVSGRLVAIGLDSTVGAGGGAASYSDDDGGSWIDGSDGTGLHPHRIMYSPSGDRFVISLADDDNVWLTDDGTTTGGAFPATGLATGEATNGLAIITETLPGPITIETIVILGSLTGAVGRPAFRKTQDGGTTWSAASQLNAGVYTGIGCLCGNNGTTIYHLGILTGGASLRVSSSTTGTVWTTAATLHAPTGTTFSGTAPRIMQCADTGLLVIVAPLASGLLAIYGSLDGTTWVGPQLLGASFNLNAFALAGGKLFATRNDQLFASDGVLIR